jgi:peptidoglycan/LPS O-acetylase OafA/YrhL
MSEVPTTEASLSGSRESRRPRRVLRGMALALLWALLGLLTLWAVAALYFDVRILWLHLPLAAIYGAGMLAALTWVRPRRLAAGICAGGFVLVLGWWFSLKPTARPPFVPSARRRTARRGTGGC